MFPTLVDALVINNYSLSDWNKGELKQYQLPSKFLKQWSYKMRADRKAETKDPSLSPVRVETINCGSHIYFEMDIAEEVENMKSSLKSSLKAYEGTGFVSNYSYHLHLEIPSHLRTSIAA